MPRIVIEPKLPPPLTDENRDDERKVILHAIEPTPLVILELLPPTQNAIDDGEIEDLLPHLPPPVSPIEAPLAYPDMRNGLPYKRHPVLSLHPLPARPKNLLLYGTVFGPASVQRKPLLVHERPKITAKLLGASTSPIVENNGVLVELARLERASLTLNPKLLVPMATLNALLQPLLSIVPRFENTV